MIRTHEEYRGLKECIDTSTRSLTERHILLIDRPRLPSSRTNSRRYACDDEDDDNETKGCSP